VVLAPALIARERPGGNGRLARGRDRVRQPRRAFTGAVDARAYAGPKPTYEIGADMSTSEQKVMQYLDEALATELALVRVLQSQIAMTPGGSYRDGLERHLDETRDHARRIEARLEDLGRSANPLGAAVGLVETVIGQALALSKTPFDLLRGSGGEEKVLKNAKDACATEALEIATYTALERLARSVGDDETARLAASIRGDEERMLERVLREIPKLTEAVVGADVRGEPSYRVADTGAADAVRAAGTQTKRTARQARKVPGVARAEGRAKGAVASQEDLAIARYDALTAEEIVGRLANLSQIELAKVAAYERRHQSRSTILDRVDTLQGDEPWPGYDELTADEVRAVLSEGDDDRAREVRAYERAHKNRAGVLKAAEREAAAA
jgi:ferritin-like metal-binding protein YciE